ncbi:hypothetical protein MMC16_006922 [Acarospora aff. strigata]|nr:hypothetical protein [Acarospora aff. strigata]
MYVLHGGDGGGGGVAVALGVAKWVGLGPWGLQRSSMNEVGDGEYGCVVGSGAGAGADKGAAVGSAALGLG